MDITFLILFGELLDFSPSPTLYSLFKVLSILTLNILGSGSPVRPVIDGDVSLS